MISMTAPVDEGQRPLANEGAVTSLPVPKLQAGAAADAFQRALVETDAPSTQPSLPNDQPAAGNLSEFNNVARNQWLHPRGHAQDDEPQGEWMSEEPVPLVPVGQSQPLASMNLGSTNFVPKDFLVNDLAAGKQTESVGRAMTREAVGQPAMHLAQPSDPLLMSARVKGAAAEPVFAVQDPRAEAAQLVEPHAAAQASLENRAVVQQNAVDASSAMPLTQTSPSLGSEQAQEWDETDRPLDTGIAQTGVRSDSVGITNPSASHVGVQERSAPRVDAQVVRDVVHQVHRTLAQRDLEALDAGRTVVVSLPRGDLPVARLELTGDGQGGLASITLVTATDSGAQLLSSRSEDLSSVLRQDTPGIRLDVRSDETRVSMDAPADGALMGGSQQDHQGSQQPSRDDVAQALDRIQQRSPAMASDELLAAVNDFERRLAADQ